MQGIIDILKGERGFLAILLIIAITTLAITGHATFEQWLEYTKWIFGVFAATKTATTVAGLITTKGHPAAPKDAG